MRQRRPAVKAAPVEVDSEMAVGPQGVVSYGRTTALLVDIGAIERRRERDGRTELLEINSAE